MSDNDRPWFKFYPRDYLTDEKVQTLTLAAQGFYMRLLCVMWKASSCMLPNDPERLFRIAGSGLDRAEFISLWSELMPEEKIDQIFKIRNGRVFSKRLLIEKNEAEKRISDAKKAGKASGRSRRNPKEKRTGVERPLPFRSNGTRTEGQPLGNHTDTDTDTDTDTFKRTPEETPGLPSPGSNTHEEIDNLLNRYPDQKTLNHVFELLATTRKTGRIAYSIVLAQLQKWDRYPVEQVLGGIHTYIDKDYAGEGKAESYLYGIIRNWKPGRDQGRNQDAPDHFQSQLDLLDKIDAGAHG